MIRFSLQIDGTPVDLFNDESIPLTRQLKDLMNLSTVWTDYTKDFQIPASETNNAIFENWFDENMVMGTWNPNLGKDGTIFIHGLPVRLAKGIQQSCYLVPIKCLSEVMITYQRVK